MSDFDVSYDQHISIETYLFLRAEVERLRSEAAWWRHHCNTWYLRANYSREELDEMYLRSSKGQDKDGNWLWPDNMKTNIHGQTIEP